MTVPACSIGRKYRESSFYHCGVTVKQVQGCLETMKQRENRFHHSEGLVKLVQVCLSGRND